MESLKIYIDRLKDGHTEKMSEVLSPDFLDVKEEELTFKDPVKVEAESYLADEYLMVQLSVETSACLPCTICNQPVSFPVSIKNLSITQPLNEVKGAIFDLEEGIREAVLLHPPLFTECNQGKCPEREHIKKFLKADGTSSGPGEHNYLPFSDLK